MNAPNPTADAFRAHGQFNGLTPLDESVAAYRENQSALALKDEAIAQLRDALGESEAELDTLRGMLAEREGVEA